MSHGGHYKFDLTFSDCFMIVEIDASRFDAGANSQFLQASFGILRSCFGPDFENDIAFTSIMDSFINGEIIGPDGRSVSSSKGIKSGDPMTSPIGSIYSFCIWIYTINKCPAFVNSGITVEMIKFAFCGDDVLLGFLEAARGRADFDKLLLDVSK